MRAPRPTRRKEKTKLLMNNEERILHLIKKTATCPQGKGARDNRPGGRQAELQHLEFPKNTNLDVLRGLLKQEAGWPITKSIRSIIPMLVAMLNPCETIENELPYYF